MMHREAIRDGHQIDNGKELKNHALKMRRQVERIGIRKEVTETRL
jgi:hypothetical protein